MLKWIFRIGGGLLALIFLAGSVAAISFAVWRADAIAERENDPARKIANTRLGPVEYAVEGEGLPVLSIHGTPGGYDQSLAVQRITQEDTNSGIMTIAVSRPGYLGTPLSSGATFEEQADLLAALLDRLGIEKAIVFGASGGGHTSLQFALRHPERTMGLLLYAPETKAAPAGSPDPRDAPEMSGWRMKIVEAMMWLAGGRLAPYVVPEFDAQDPVQKRRLSAMMKTMVPWSAHTAGQQNDLSQRFDDGVNAWPVEEIEAPTLILHGNSDTNSPYEHSRELSERIPNAELVTFKDADHYAIITRWREVSSRAQSFLDRFGPNSEIMAGQEAEAMQDTRVVASAD